MGKVMAFFGSVPFRVSVTVLGMVFAISQGASVAQGLLDSRYQKREDAAKSDAMASEIIRRLERMESKLDRLSP